MGNLNRTMGSSGFNQTQLNEINSKYIDIYNSYNNTIFGDAVFETSSSSSGSNSWYGDYSNFIISSSPWFVRGGFLGYSSGAGVFAFHYSYGSASVSVSFRPVARPAT